MAQHKTMTTQFIDGEAKGLRLCNCVGSLITTVYMPRSYLARAKQLGLPSRGIYFLLKVDGTVIKKMYVGQTTQGINRLNDHNAKRKWWDRAVLFLSDDFNNFTLDTVNGLEKYAIEKAMGTMPAILENKVAPKYQIMPFQKPFIESLYHEVEFMMAALGVKLVSPAAAAPNAQAGKKQVAKKVQPVVTQPAHASAPPQGGMAVTMTRRGISVSGVYSGGAKGTLTLHAGAAVDIAAKIKPKDKGTLALRQQLAAQGKLVSQDGNLATLGEDVTFASPTAAAQFVYGGSINGRVNWKDASGKSIKDVWG